MINKILIALVSLLVIAGIIFTVIVVRQRQEVRKEAAGGAGTTEVTLSQKTGSFPVNQSFTIGVSFNTKSIQVDTIQLVFDVTGATAESIADQQIQGLTWQLKTITPTANGSQIKLLANATIGSTYTNNSPTLLANLSLKAAQTGTVQITFNQQLSKILIAGQDILLTPENGSYTITGGAAATPTPTPTPTPGGTPTPTPTPGGATATPTPTPTPTTRPTATPTPTPAGGVGGPNSTPTPTPRPTSTPTPTPRPGATATPTPRPATSSGVPVTANFTPTMALFGTGFVIMIIGLISLAL